MLNRFLRELVRHFGRGRGDAPPGAAAGAASGKLGDPVGGEPSYEALFRAHAGRLVDKWSHYFEIYDRHLRQFRNRRVKVLEIGVYHGGSLQLLRRFLGPQADVVGVDIDPRCADYAEPGIRIETGDQSSPEFWASFFARNGPFDIIVDDGSHLNPHMITTFTSVWPFLNDAGILLFEDCHTSYLEAAGGGLRTKGSFIEFAKDRIDDLNALWVPDKAALAPSRLAYELGSISCYDSVVVFEKRVRTGPPRRVFAGTPSRELTPMEQQTVAAARAK
jgi:SAM-dependent methyltransferase